MKNSFNRGWTKFYRFHIPRNTDIVPAKRHIFPCHAKLPSRTPEQLHIIYAVFKKSEQERQKDLKRWFCKAVQLSASTEFKGSQFCTLFTKRKVAVKLSKRIQNHSSRFTHCCLFLVHKSLNKVRHGLQVEQASPAHFQPFLVQTLPVLKLQQKLSLRSRPLNWGRVYFTLFREQYAWRSWLLSSEVARDACDQTAV